MRCRSTASGTSIRPARPTGCGRRSPAPAGASGSRARLRFARRAGQICQMAEQSVATGYRADIDGLRAVAVLLVLGLHVFPDVVVGGFVGVDVFFVISGYLISGILMGSLDAKTFSILRFYDRRIRRIFPPLLAVLAAVLIYGWFRLLPADLMQLGGHVAAAAAFIRSEERCVGKEG